MEIELILKIAGIGILIAVVNQVLKHIGKDEIATFTTLAGVIVVLIMVLDMVSNLFDTVKSLFGLY
ncbi:MAG: stage III sporulation protein AC [Clostridia bacterium]|nr:stage III sporulation protein AC [Clostridia bacterium]